MDENYSSRRIELRVLGLSYREIKEGAYALILAEVGGQRYIPIVIGTPEAQSIAMRLEHIIPPRPTTHDIFSSFSHAFGIRLIEVFIHRFDDGIFISELTFEGPDGSRISLDARTSDAIAIAMRTHSPIFTTPEIIEETGFVVESKTESDPDDPDRDPNTIEITIGSPRPADRAATSFDLPYEDEDEDDYLPVEELEEKLANLIAEERYEEAAELAAKIRKRKDDEANITDIPF